ncbi:MAG: MHYT domain-containing protein [Hyphomicrobiaceae bacterium]
MSVSHEPWLVILSIIVAIQGAYVGLSIVLRFNTAAVGIRKRLLAGGAATLAIAIWSMHFVGMLAMRQSAQIDFLLVPTVVSFLVCVVLVGLAVYVASTNPQSQIVLAFAATVMGVGIISMHFIGMLAVLGNMTMSHDHRYMAASIVIGIVASNLAIRLAFASTPPPLALASIALGLAISGMHYAAMAGCILSPSTIADPNAATLSHDVLAVLVSLVAFLISGFFFLTLVPDSDGAVGLSRGAATPGSSPSAAVPTQTVDRLGNNSQSDGGAVGALPVTKDNATVYIPVARVFAVKADGHYTSVFDGHQSYFCGLSISDVEARLDPQLFMRVHRSYLVNLKHVASVKRSGDGGVANMSGEITYALPISRRKLSELKSRLEHQKPG